MYLNEIKIIGFVGQDAELKSPNSKELVRFDSRNEGVLEKP